MTYQNLITKNYETLKTKDNENFLVVGEGSEKILIKLFYNKAEMIVVDKTSFLEERQSVYGTFRDDVNPLSFVVDLEVDLPINFNYAYIPIFSRYYFIDSVSYISNNIASITFSVDVLMSHKNAILKQKGFIDRNENGRDVALVDNKNVALQGYTQFEVEIENTIFHGSGETVQGVGSVGEVVVNGFALRLTN